MVARVFAVVPAKDEAARIAEVIRTMPAFIEGVVVVDDGSADDTAQVAREADLLGRVEVVTHRTSRGVGAAIEAGYARAFSRGADRVAVLAGDGQMDPADLAGLLAALDDGADYAKGTRLRVPGVRSAMSTPRWLGSHVLSGLTRVVTGLAVEDSQCGYTALSRRGHDALRAFGPFWPGYGYPNDLLVRAARAGLRVVEVEVRPVYVGKTGGMRARHALVSVPRAILHGRSAHPDAGSAGRDG